MTKYPKGNKWVGGLTLFAKTAIAGFFLVPTLRVIGIVIWAIMLPVAIIITISNGRSSD